MNENDFLTSEQLSEVTGYKHIASEREWLDKSRGVRNTPLVS